MKCPNCGHENTRAQATCTECGTSLADTKAQATQDAQERVPAYNNAANPNAPTADTTKPQAESDKSEYIKGDRSSREASIGGRQPSTAPNQSFANQAPGSTQAGPMEAPAQGNPHKSRASEDDE